MKLTRTITATFAAAALAALFRCGNENGIIGSGGELYQPASFQDTYTAAPGDQVFFKDTLDSVDLTYTLDLGNPGSGGKNVYFIFTNTSVNYTVPAPAVRSNVPVAAALSPARFARGGSADPLPGNLQPEEPLQRGTPEITAYNRIIHRQESDRGPLPGFAGNRTTIPAGPRLDVVNTSKVFHITETTDISAVCMYSAVADGKTLNVYVPLSLWSNAAAPPDGYVGQAMVDQLAQKFLAAGPDNDIHDWVSAIYGEEWGPHTDASLIDPDNTITILLFDIPYANTSGYFYSKDNYKLLDWSNKRIMFYLDLKYYATREGGTWEISDWRPAQIISTLAHEYQHMIHFYQKSVLRTSGVNSDTWIDEMCALVAEDLVARKLGVAGPRGVAPEDPTGGTGVPLNSAGRLPGFNGAMDTGIVGWYAGGATLSYILQHYAAKYAYGAYLARNFGGATLFHDILYNTETDFRAVQYALDNAAGGPYPLLTTLRQWGVACILSDKTADVPYKYNNGSSWMSSIISGITLDLGSINLKTYTTQPLIYTFDNNPALPAAELQPTANRYYRAGTGLTGQHTWRMTFDYHTRLTVVVRD